MYGNSFDYGNPSLDDTRDEIDAILKDTRANVSELGNSSVYANVTAGMGDRLSSVGVGGVGDFLEEAYTPYAPVSTSYSDWMADTPQRIKDVIGATNEAYQEGRDERTKDFQDLLAEMRDYSYGTGSYAGDEQPKKDKDKPKNDGPAVAELQAISTPGPWAPGYTPTEEDASLSEIFSSPPAGSLAAKYIGTSTSTPVAPGPYAPSYTPTAEDATASDVFTNPPSNSLAANYIGAPSPVDPGSLLAKFKDGNETKLANSMEAYDNQFGKSVSMKEYNKLLDQGVSQNFLRKNLLKYQQAGGVLKDKLSDFLNG